MAHSRIKTIITTADDVSYDIANFMDGMFIKVTQTEMQITSYGTLIVLITYEGIN